MNGYLRLTDSARTFVKFLKSVFTPKNKADKIRLFFIVAALVVAIFVNLSQVKIDHKGKPVFYLDAMDGCYVFQSHAGRDHPIEDGDYKMLMGVDCEKSHHIEVFAAVNLPSSDAPGFDALEEMVPDVCVEKYVRLWGEPPSFLPDIKPFLRWFYADDGDEYRDYGNRVICYTHESTDGFTDHLLIEGDASDRYQDRAFDQQQAQEADQERTRRILALTEELDSDAAGLVVKAYQTAEEYIFADAEASTRDLWESFKYAGEALDAYVERLEQIKAGYQPDAEANFEAADKALNAAYKELIAIITLKGGTGNAPEGQTAPLSPVDLRDVQRLWIQHRDASSQLFFTLNPVVPKERWAAWLTSQRTLELESLAAP